MRGRDRRHDPNGNAVLKAGDIVILQGEPAALERVVALEKLALTRDHAGHAQRITGRRDRRDGGGGDRRTPS